MSQADHIVQALKIEAHQEVMEQAFRTLQKIAMGTDIGYLPEVKEALNYFYSGLYKPGFIPKIITSYKTYGDARKEAMHQARDLFTLVGAVSGAIQTPATQQLFNKVVQYFDAGVFSAAGPDLQSTVTKVRAERPQGSLKKYSEGTKSLSIRYAVTPAGESRGEFARVFIDHNPNTNQFTAVSPDLPGIVVSNQQISKVIEEIPGAIKRRAQAYEDRPVTVERVDWPQGHPK